MELSAQASPTAAAVSVLSPPQMSPPRESACAECGHALRAGAQFCPACGSAVTTSLAASVVPTSVPAIIPGVEADTELAAPVVALTPSPPPTVPPETAPPVDSPSVAVPPVPPVDAPPAGRGHRRVDDRRVLVGAVGVLALVLAGILVLVLTAGGSKHGPSPLARSVAHTSSTVAPPAASATATAQVPPLTTATTQAGATTGPTVTGTNATPVSDPITQVPASRRS